MKNSSFFLVHLLPNAQGIVLIEIRIGKHQALSQSPNERYDFGRLQVEFVNNGVISLCKGIYL